MQITIRQTTDYDLVRELDHEIFRVSPNVEDDELYESVWWVVSIDGRPAGYAGIRGKDDTKAEMTRAGVVQWARGGGLQKRLIRVRVAWAKRRGFSRVYTYTWAGNYASMSSLASCGFRPYYLEDGKWLYWQRRFAKPATDALRAA